MRVGMLPGLVLLVMAAMGCAAGGEAVRPGRVVVEAPTIVCLGVRWYVQGDENGNASVRVSYRRKGEEEWREGLPLFRVGRGPEGEEGEARLIAGEGRRRWPFPLGNLFAGSVFDLEADTAYEMRLELSDPDGGSATKVVEARTRPEPSAPEPARVLHVAPGGSGGSGREDDPLRGLVTANAAARAGDLLLLHAGVYEGTFLTDKSGEPGRPIVWRAAGDGEAVIEARGEHRGVSANAVHDVFFEGLTIRNAEYGMVAHGASDMVVRGCHFYGNEYGFAAYKHEPLIRNVYLADNVFEGPSTWPRTKGIEDARGVQISGEGHVVCYNRVRGFGDGIDIMSSPPNRAIDFYGNEISECTDDAIEMDYGMSNVRAFRNRITNCFEGISTQPLYGGPCYVFRNAMYNLEYTPFKMHNSPWGVVLLHNTAVKAGVAWPLYTRAEVTNCMSRNNLFVGAVGDYAMEFLPRMVECDFDYDGFGGGPFEQSGKWNGRAYGTFEEFRRESGIEGHAVWVGAGTPFASGVKAPGDFREQFPLGMNDLRLAAGSAAVDAGVTLPNVNDRCRGRGPDLGAYELGEALPDYGPRRRERGGTGGRQGAS